MINDKSITNEVINEQLDILNRAFKEFDWENFADNNNMKSFIELTAVPDFNFCNTISNTFIPIDSTFNIRTSTLDALQNISPIYGEKNIINIYVVELKDSLSGFSTLPHISKDIDAIVIDKSFFGIHLQNHKNYNQGKTLVHLMASFLGLNELWDENLPCKDDAIEDTPIHNYANFSLGTDMKNVSTCEGNPIELVINYMDNLPDMYNVMFTKGQVERMKRVINSKYGRQYYNTLWCETQIRKSTSPNIVIYPNPNTGLLFLSTNQTLNEVSVNIFNSFGLQVSTYQYKIIEGGSTIDLNLQNLPSGLYNIQLYSSNRLVKHSNFVRTN
ncbi:MAG: M43 family zinc metalloprotease [Saprospiraceae bacterium]